MDLNGVNDHTWVHDQKFLFSTRSSWSTCIQEGVVLLRSRSSRNILGSCSIFQVCSCLMTLVGNSSKKIWEIEVWMFFSSGYGSLPINTIFSGMNIHLPAILGFTRGTGFWPIPSWSPTALRRSSPRWRKRTRPWGRWIPAFRWHPLIGPLASENGHL